MDKGRLPDREPDFQEARRRTAAADPQVDIDRSRPHRLRTTARRALAPALVLAVVTSLAFIVVAIPSPPDPQIEQRIASHVPAASNAPSPARSDTDVEPQKEAPEKRPKKKHKRIVIAEVEGTIHKAATVSVGGEAASGRPARPKRKKAAPNSSEKTERQLPEATLLFRRLYKDRNGDHFHSVYADKIAAKEEAGYRVREAVGYLYEKQVRGTTLFTIGEGTMGWICTEDQGKQTIPLYRLVGPDYHDNEVVLTSSEDVKAYWIGNGWREDRVVGYIVRP